MKRIAVLDHELHVVDAAAEALGAAGFRCYGFSRTRTFFLALDRESFDLLIVDWNMPEISGRNILKLTRVRSRAMSPILLMTAPQSGLDVVEALAAGADDYLPKPVRSSDLVERAQNLIRRHDGGTDVADLLEVKPFRFDLRAGRVYREDKLLELTEKEFLIALMLFRNLGRPISRGHLHDLFWGGESAALTRTLDTHISRLRLKLALSPAKGFLLSSIRGYGYRLERLADYD